MHIQTGDYLSIPQIKVLRQFYYTMVIYSSIPVCYSISMSENYNNMIVLLDSLNYNNHNWMIFGDLKVIYYNIYYNNYNYLKCFIMLIYAFVYRRHISGYAIWVYQIP